MFCTFENISTPKRLTTRNNAIITIDIILLSTCGRNRPFKTSPQSVISAVILNISVITYADRFPINDGSGPIPARRYCPVPP